MSLQTTVVRDWLTKSFKPFVFTNQFDKELDYEDAENLGLYVHIPFCRTICSFCPYCKIVYEKEKCDDYIDYLLKEINLVGKMNPCLKKVTSLYFGGGSPCLAIDSLGKIISTIKKYFEITEGIGVELHPSDVTLENLTKLKAAGVDRISIGIQSFQDKFLSTLGRGSFDIKSMKEALSAIKFKTVSMDFIFALPNQTFEDLKADIEKAIEVGANHFAIYPFISFTFAKSNIPVMKKNAKRALLDKITLYCEEKKYTRDSIWTFCVSGKEKYSSMTRENFLGFGVSATTLLRDQFKINTFSINEYKKRLNENILPTALTIKFTLRQRMIYFLFWTAYTTKVSASSFERFFEKKLKAYFGLEFWFAKKAGYFTEENGVYKMTLKGAFYYHYYENYYTLSYIDKMWNVMRKVAFPESLKL